MKRLFVPEFEIISSPTIKMSELNTHLNNSNIRYLIGLLIEAETNDTIKDFLLDCVKSYNINNVRIAIEKHNSAYIEMFEKLLILK